MLKKRFGMAGICLATLLLVACKPPKTVSYEILAGGLTNRNEIARLDIPSTRMICSFDRTGANEDYNHFQGKRKDGQCILADLNGPGVISRLWFTGINDDKKIRFYFDGEKTPRLEFSWNDLRSGVPPFDVAPFSTDEQNCWYTFAPVPFKKHLLITTEDAGYQYGRGAKMYYQLNWSPMPAGRTVESLNPSQSSSELRKISKVWENDDFSSLPLADKAFELSAGQTIELWSGTGPATVQAFTIDSDVHDSDALRNILLNIYWDGSAEPSVRVPLGDFFGSVWQRWRARSMFFGSKGDLFFCRFPMPFQKSARFVLENKSAHNIALKFGIQTGIRIDGGYFHAGWRNSSANETGIPHTVLKTAGRGRYVGCILSVVSADRSFWALESDESMVIDGTKTWQGTGLEDYFNAGWYYGNVFARPLHGLPNKAPFRTVQYRLHLTEPVLFGRDFKMEFERGPDQASHAAYENVSFYYLETPQAADSHLESRAAPVDALQAYTLMTDLWNYERFGDLQGEAEYIDRYNMQFKAPFEDVLNLRKLVCFYQLKQISQQRFVEGLNASTNAQAEILRKLYTVPGTALLQLYCNMPSELYLDGELVLRGGDPKQSVCTTVNLPKGRHVLAAASGWQEYPKWTQVAVCTADGFLIGTSGDWKHAVNPSGAWAALDYDDAAWTTLKNYDGRVKGPPEEPYVWVNPDPFVNTLSQASGLRPSAPWGSKKGRVVYRKVFEVQ
ncbi:MAG: glycoside hydrolase family 172 protein [Kiritimatiellales bacterium]